MGETHFRGDDMARVIAALRPELDADQFQDLYPSVLRRMTDITANPEKPVNLRTADAVVTAMGCPHVLTNGAVRVVEGYNRKAPEPMSVPANGNVPDLMLPAAPFRKWMERQCRYYRTLTSMYHDLDLPPKLGSQIWRGQKKQVPCATVERSMSRRGQHYDSIYPQLNGKAR